MDCCNFSILQREYLLSSLCDQTVIMRSNSPMISDITKKTFSDSVSIRMMRNYDKSAVMQISRVFGTL